MFYAHFVLSKKGPLARIWLAAHWDKKLTRAHVFETNISSSVEAILEPKLKMALRTSGHLLLGVVRIYSRKAKYLLADCNEAFVKIKMAFRPGVVDLPDEANREAAIAAITLPENLHDFEATIADLNEINMNTIAINQSRPEDITMREDFGEINLGRQDDDFGDSAFEEASSREVVREGDKTYGDSMYRASGQLSVRGGTDFSIRSDVDMDATLIGGNHLDGLHSHKHEKHADLAARPDDIGIDDNDFGDGFLGAADDDDENFGGEIDHSLFADAAIFEDPSAQKQLEHLTSEIESHMDTARFGLHDGTTPVPSSGVGSEEHVQTIVEKSTSQFPEVTAAAEPNLTAVPVVNLGASRVGGTTIHGESTTLITNESEAFALPPIDATSVMGTETRRPGKRKRRLVIDELKSIPSETMKLQMEDTSDITTQLDLAPPTKKLMHWKETGSVDKLFTLPGRAIYSRVLLRLFVSNLHVVPSVDDATEELLHPLRLGFVPPVSQAGPTALPDETSQPSLSELSNHDLSGTKSPGVTFENTLATMGGQKLDVIHEMAEEGSNQLPFDRLSSHPDEVHPGDANDDYDDGHMHDDLSFMPPSILSEAPPSVMQADMLALERELAKADDEAEKQLALAFAAASPDPAVHRHADGGVLDAPDSLASPDIQEGQSTLESLEERRLEKRSKVLLRMLRTHQQQMGWDEPLALQSICVGNTKKQAASKFYTILLLRKQGAVELGQEEAYGEILISQGPNFNRLVEV
ncbi:Double-strand-break repair protein rad21 [Clonorchis sinensis]|uniref:Double-strand-break repair protein rad21 n=1 Tax=Clonorchis sinensis TaxID=79923 RepID=A0A419Q9F2_CLOSI|nr:Double-strand-break repair protein rad21 [Clonorchis sinensis]